LPAADLYEGRFGKIFALLACEARKSLPDSVAEIREAVNFLHYYGTQAPLTPSAGLFTCISPKNLPFAISSLRSVQPLLQATLCLPDQLSRHADRTSGNDSPA
jgi:delta 1-pyrroline-5-carboxylate dehydrogenase